MCLSLKHPQLFPVLALFVVKELFQLIAGAVHLKMGKMLPNSNIRVLKVTYEDEVETAVECIWDSGDIDGFFYESKTGHAKKSGNTISK